MAGAGRAMLRAGSVGLAALLSDSSMHHTHVTVTVRVVTNHSLLLLQVLGAGASDAPAVSAAVLAASAASGFGRPPAAIAIQL